jgi:PAS domain S-box-containing protein/putative nucleotidyltransferase with HDIG domain
LTGKNQILEQIYNSKPDHIKVMDHVTARIFWDMMKLRMDRNARYILEAIRDAFIVVNSAGDIMQYNKAAEQMFGGNYCGLSGNSVLAFIKEVFGQEGLKMLDHKEVKEFNFTALRGTDREFPAEVSFFPVDIDENNYLVISIRDVTERIKAQEEISRLYRYETLYNQVVAQFALTQDVEQSIQDTVQMLGENLEAKRITLWYINLGNGSKVLKGQWKTSAHFIEECLDLKMPQVLPMLWDKIKAAQLINIYNLDIVGEPDRTTLQKLGVESLVGLPIVNFHRVWGVLFLENSGDKLCSNEEIEILTSIVNIMQNAIQRDEAQKALEESEALYQAMIERSLTGIYIIQDGLIRFVNKRMTEMLGYSFEELINQEPKFIVHPDDHPLLKKKLEDRMSGRVQSLHYTLRGSRKDGERIWLESMSSLVMIKGRPAIMGNIMDVTERIRHDETRNRMIDAITMLAGSMAEQRDPYTAGHQRRVAEIAVAIGEQMSLSASCIEGLRLSALLHDIGKFAVPIEILTKPGKLRSSEFQFIKMHSQFGAEILAEMPFPCDISSVVEQHHERINGSGYPAGLRGEQISLEARIIAVADVVEAMSSHRPYRPSLGLEAAIQEVTQNQGVLYDVKVVSALLNIVDKLDL